MAEREAMFQEALANLWRYRSTYSSERIGTRQALSPNGTIAFTNEGELWLIKPDGSDKRALVTDIQGILSPAWSHDGKQIAFVGQGTGEFCLYTVEASNGSRSTLACNFVDATYPRWSPDDRHIALFATRTSNDDLAAWVVKIDGSSIVPLAGHLPQNWSPAWIDSSTVVFPGEVEQDGERKTQRQRYGKLKKR